MTDFDVTVFENLVAEGAMATRYEPVPEGEYQALIKEVSPTVITTDEGPRPALRLTWLIVGDDAEKLAQELGRREVTVNQTVFLDIEQDKSGNYRLATGKGQNVQLGRIREALGQNTGGKWEYSMLRGAGPAVIMVRHVASKTNPEDIYANVVNVRPME